jgi:hypothetical protein
MKPLDQKDFKAKVIKDLGTKPTSSGNLRFIIVECTKCKTHYETRAVTAKRSKEGLCIKCSSVKNSKTHGLSTHPLYSVWKDIKARCTNPNSENYKKYYGAKGVTMCEEWLNSPETFIKWALNNGWKKGMHIDKDIKNENDTAIYSPFTCSVVDPRDNNLAISYYHKRELPKGVYYMPNQKGRVFAQVSINGKSIYLGSYTLITDAVNAYNDYIEAHEETQNYERSTIGESAI